MVKCIDELAHRDALDVSQTLVSHDLVDELERRCPFETADEMREPDDFPGAGPASWYR
jgi:hypothetical protein